MRPRVVLDATPLLYTRTGIGRVTAMLIQAMNGMELPFELVLFGRRLGGARLRELLPGLRSHRLRLPRKAESVIRDLRLVELLCRGDLYHATDFYLPVRTRSVVATFHDTIFLANPERMVDHARLRKWVPRFVKQCRRVITVSQHSKRDITAHLGVPPEQIDVVYPGVDHAVFWPSHDPEATREKLPPGLIGRRPYFLAVSCSLGRKNTRLLLDAYARLVRNDPRNDLVLVWSPPPEIRAKYTAGPLADRVHFIGRQPDQVLADLYRCATALVFPSLYEGFGLPVAEAMACGAPVISSCSSSMPEVGGEAALYIDPRDAGSLEAALEKLEQVAQLAADLSRQSIARAAHFTWERAARETALSYTRALAGGA
jgi:glycosyltransferase involved in cell wall biosynthesis